MSVSVENPRINIRICKKLSQFIAFCVIMEHPKTNVTEETRILWCQTVSVGYPPAGYKTEVFFYEWNTLEANIILLRTRDGSNNFIYTSFYLYFISPIPCMQLISKLHTHSMSTPPAALPEKLFKSVLLVQCIQKKPNHESSVHPLAI